jgi:hypothetical protein
MSDSDRLTMGSSEVPFEEQLIKERRGALELDQDREKTVGLALSGGGIRSAIFSLGLLQAMAKTTPDSPDKREQKPVLSQMDLLSTVSGGGYAGMFLGSLFMPRKVDSGVPDPVRETDRAIESPRGAANRTLDVLRGPANTPSINVDLGTEPAKKRTLDLFHPLGWLRENGRYLTPGGSGDALYLAAFYLRALVGVQYVLGIALLGAVLLLFPLRLFTQKVLSAVGGLLKWDAGSLGATSAWCEVACNQEFALWWSPLLAWSVVLIGVCAGPLILCYWTTYRQEDPRLFHRTGEEWSIESGPLVIGGAGLATLVLTAGLGWEPIRLFLAYVVFLGIASYLYRNFMLPVLLIRGWREESWTERARTIFRWKTDTGLVAKSRLILTQSLATTLGMVLVFSVAGLVDSLGQSLFAWIVHAKGGSLFGLSSGAGSLGVLAILLRKVSQLSVDNVSKNWIGLALRFRKMAAIVAALIFVLGSAVVLAVLVQVILFGVPLTNGDPITPKVEPDIYRFVCMVAAWSVLFVLVWLSEGFLNSSTFHRFYAARLIRTFLGAANFVRMAKLEEALKHRRESEVIRLFVSESHPEDDLSLRSYYRRDGEQKSLGPLHLINVTVNENLSLTSSLVREDRKGVPLCVGPAGIRTGDAFYPWQYDDHDRGNIGAKVDWAARDKENAKEGEIERLSVGSWCAVSGAAASTGMGRLSGTGYAMLAWIFNARLGYWWQAAKIMSTQRRHSPFRTYDLVHQEFFARFYGRRGLKWNLSDGGHFENTGAYELIRRRVPFIVCSDNGADPEYALGDLENLIRRVRIDFGAEVKIFGREQLDEIFKKILPSENAELSRLVGAPDEFRDRKVDNRRCALLGIIDYPSEKDQKRSVLLVVKPAAVVFAPEDVRLYGRANTAFPQQTTADQFFNEAQWESYRRLGESIGSQIFRNWQYFRLLVDNVIQRKDYFASH